MDTRSATVPAVQALLWRDYVCPWCYLGRDRTALLVDHGVSIIHLAFELHPEIPEEGVAVRAGGRLSPTLEAIADECRAVGLPFVPPSRLPRSRRALETVEVVRTDHPDAFESLDTRLYEAVFVHEIDLADRDALDELVSASGAPADEVRQKVDRGEGATRLVQSMTMAREHGVAATPAWLLDGKLLVPGVQPREVLARWVEKMRSRASGSSRP